MDLCDSLGAFREQLGLPRSDYRLWCDGELLGDDHRSLRQLGVEATSGLVAVAKTREVQVRQRGADPVSLGEIRRSISFEDFRKKASAALKTELGRGTRFVCDCGRVLSSESAARRKLAPRCCDAEDLVLTVHPPPRGESRSDVWSDVSF